MKNLFFLCSALFIYTISFSQVSKYYFTGNVKTNFEWNLIDKSNASGNVKDPLYAENGINFSIGRALSNNVRVEIGFGGLIVKNQVDAFSLNTTRYIYKPSIKVGYADSFIFNTVYLFAPTFSYIWGNGKILSNGFESENFTQGVSYGIEMSLNKKLYKKLGIQPTIRTQYEVFKHYEQTIGSSTRRQKEYLKLYPYVNLTYNF